MFTKKDLKNGMFVKMFDGKLGVIVDGSIVYETGGYDKIDEMDDDMTSDFTGYGIDCVVKAKSFKQAKDLMGFEDKLLYKRTYYDTKDLENDTHAFLDYVTKKYKHELNTQLKIEFENKLYIAEL